MTDAFPLGNQAIWKRSVAGGLLSSAIAGLTVTVSYLIPNVVSGFLRIIFLAPAYIVESFIVIATKSISLKLNEPLSIVISLLFWLVVGAVIASYFKRNKAAIGCWFLLYFLLIPITFGIFFLRHYIVS